MFDSGRLLRRAHPVGNARPVFLKQCIVALVGYELVEGRLDDNRLRETRLVNYSPRNYLPRYSGNEDTEE